MRIKLVSLNVQKKEHIGDVARFILKENSDVVVLMEAAQDQLDDLLPEYPYRVFKPNFRLVEYESLIGVVLAAKQPIREQVGFYCDGVMGDGVPYEALGAHRPVVVGGVIGDIQLYGTHFTWTPEMSWTQKQADYLENLLTKLGNEELIMCGDFNIPRGNANYKKLASRYCDNVPVQVVTTIDPDLHRANQVKRGNIAVVVDYVWSTPQYKVAEVRVESGVSDHCALVASVEKI